MNTHFCVCSFLRPLEIKTNVSLIVHVRELKLTSNTAQFAQKMLPHQAQIKIRGRIFETFDATPTLDRSGRPLFLYPHEDAEELNPVFMEKYPGPYHLIIPDGNWQQARKVRAREEAFTKLPAVKLPSGILGEYGLRKAPRPGYISTYEAMAHALGILESEYIKDRLMEFFRVWVNRTEKARSGDFKSV